jgi:hypothetical protein
MNFSSIRFRNVALFLIALSILRGAALAEITRIEIESRVSFEQGEEFEGVGEYELIKGRLHYAVESDHPANSCIVDLALAPQDPNGRVHFTSDFELLKPVDLKRGNHRLIYDVTNRGNKTVMGAMNQAWGNTPKKGTGFLMRQGYSILWSGWNWDVRDERGWIQIELPIATRNGSPIRQFIAAEIVNSTGKQAISTMETCWANCRTYSPADSTAYLDATLTVRDTPHDKRDMIPHNRWKFSRSQGSNSESGSTTIELDLGFLPGKIYELIYEVQDPPVVGLGLAAVRDAISFFHFESFDHHGTQNPLSITGNNGIVQNMIDKAYIYGSSQGGRFITQMLWQGFHVDEAGRMVFEGAKIHIAGGGKGGFNHRFAQTSQCPSDLEGNYMPADHPPFNFLPYNHIASGGSNDVLTRAKQLGKIPYIIITNTEHEYWTRSASLVHTTLDGEQDVALHEQVRLYVINGAPHRAGLRREQGVHEHSLNTLDIHWISRATLIMLDDWVSGKNTPPASRYPSLADGALINAKYHKADFVSIPGMRHPGRNFQPPQVNYGPKFWTDGIMTIIPPTMGATYLTLVPYFDTDGNGIGGVRPPDLEAPLGTYQSWNPRNSKYNNPDYLGRFEGSYWPFTNTDIERVETNDSRSSLEMRYSNKVAYIEEFETACRTLREEGFMLTEDVAAQMDFIRTIRWPPIPINNFPYWEQE